MKRDLFWCKGKSLVIWENDSFTAGKYWEKKISHIEKINQLIQISLNNLNQTINQNIKQLISKSKKLDQHYCRKEAMYQKKKRKEAKSLAYLLKIRHQPLVPNWFQVLFLLFLSSTSLSKWLRFNNLQLFVNGTKSSTNCIPSGLQISQRLVSLNKQTRMPLR